MVRIRLNYEKAVGPFFAGIVPARSEGENLFGCIAQQQGWDAKGDCTQEPELAPAAIVECGGDAGKRASATAVPALLSPQAQSTRLLTASVDGVQQTTLTAVHSRRHSALTRTTHSKPKHTQRRRNSALHSASASAPLHSHSSCTAPILCNSADSLTSRLSRSSRHEQSQVTRGAAGPR